MGILAALVGVALAAGPPPKLTEDKLIAGMAKLDEAFDPARNPHVIRYEKTAKYHGVNADGKPRVVTTKATLARQAQKIFAHVIHTDTLGQPDTNAEIYYSWGQGVLARRRNDTLDYFSYLLPIVLNYFEYTGTIYVDTFKYIEAPYEEDSIVPAGKTLSEKYFEALPRMVVENRKHYALRPALEEVDGAWCHVLEWPGYDAIWIDAQRSFAPVRRESRIRGHLRTVAKNTGFVQSRPGLWLPTQSEQTTYLIPGMPSDRLKAGDVAHEQQIKLVDLKFGKVDDATFRVPIDPAETLIVHDSVRHMTYVRHPAGTDPVSAAVREVETRKARTWAMSREASLIVLNGICLSGVLMLFLIRQVARVQRRTPA